MEFYIVASMEKMIYMDSPELIGLNTIIACRGKDVALKAYLTTCERVKRRPKKWAVRYLDLYVKYSKSKDTYIDVRASKKALTEAMKFVGN